MHSNASMIDLNLYAVKTPINFRMCCASSSVYVPKELILCLFIIFYKHKKNWGEVVIRGPHMKLQGPRQDDANVRTKIMEICRFLRK